MALKMYKNIPIIQIINNAIQIAIKRWSVWTYFVWKIWIFDFCRKNWICWNICLHFGCVLYYKLLCLMRLSDSVSFSVYMKIFWRYFWTFLENMSQKCEQFSYELLFCDCLGFGVLNGPPPPPSPASMSKFPSGWKRLKTIVLNDFLWFYKKLKNCINIVLQWYQNDYVV